MLPMRRALATATRVGHLPSVGRLPLRCARSTRFAARASSNATSESSDVAANLSVHTGTASLTSTVAKSSSGGVDLLARAESLGIRLTPKERAAFADLTGGKGKMSVTEYEDFVRSRTFFTNEQLTLHNIRESVHNDSLGKKMIVAIDYLGTSLFAVVGAEMAGQAGMNVVGCTLVGCIAAMGGGTVNNLITGVTPVFWLRDPSFLVCAALSSVAAFYLWPEYESRAAANELQRRPSLRNHPESTGGATRLHERARARVMDSMELYVLESVALSVVGIIGARHGISRGLPPAACVALGVSVCAGGVMRDVICHRDVAIGSQSFALATATGATVYVGLRQLAERGFVTLISVRICLAAAATLVQRAFAWQHKQSTGEPFLAPYAHRRSAAGAPFEE